MDFLRHTMTWLLDLDRVSLDAERLSLQWLQPVDSWLWFIIAVATVGFAATVYRREGGPVMARLFMAASRTVLILLIVIIICEPAIVLHQDRKEPSIIAVMVDDSASMNQIDHYDARIWDRLSGWLGAPDRGQRSPIAGEVSRWDIVDGLIGDSSDDLMPALLKHHQVRFFRFSSTASQPTIVRRWPAGEATTLSDGAPNGVATDLIGSIRQVFDACVDTHLAGIVLISDGQPTQQSGLDPIAKLSAERDTPVHVILTGSASPPVDVAVENVRITPHAYVGDRVACSFSIRTTGLPTGTVIDLALRDKNGAAPLATTTIVVEGEDDEAIPTELDFEPTTARTMVLELEARAAEGERDLDNNVAEMQVMVVENRAQVLYVEGYPRYDFRYLKNTLLRDPTVVVSTLLLSADEEFAQEGNVPIRRFPASAEELLDYDVVLLGDVDLRGTWITDSQLDMLVQFVARDGGGLALLAGGAHMPAKLNGTPLARLLPVKPGAGDDLSTSGQAFLPQPTPAGATHPVLRLLHDHDDHGTLFEELPEWYWTSPVIEASPGAEVLLQRAAQDVASPPTPIVALKRFGAGTVLFHGSDDTWRWRRYRGEAFFDAYWLQVIRHLAYARKFPTPRGVVLRTDRSEASPYEPIQVNLTFEQQDQARLLPEDVEVQIKPAGDAQPFQLRLQRLGPGSCHFQGSFTPRRTGQLDIRFIPRDYALNLADLSTRVEIARRRVEYARPEANRQLMERLAALTHGSVVEPWEAQALAENIPARHSVVPNDITETIWDSKLVLMLFVGTIMFEWILRKRKGLT